jgi:hypothetical protein
MINNQFNNCQINIHVTQAATEQAKDELLGLPAKQSSKLDSMLAETLEITITKAIPALFTEVVIPLAKIGCIVLLKTANVLIVDVLAPVCTGTLKGIVHVVRQQKLLQATKEAKLLEAPQQDLTFIEKLPDGTEIYNTK